MTDTPMLSARKVSPSEHMMFRMEEIPSARSSGIGVAILDRAPDFDRLVRVYERASRLFLRLRQRIVVPALPITSPEWVTDPDFDLSYHVRRVRVPEPGTLRQVFDIAEPLVMAPYDRARPLWVTTLVEGLEGGKAALLLRQHHAMADGLGAVQLMHLLYDEERDPPARPMPPLPTPEYLTPERLARRALRGLPGTLARGLSEGFGAAQSALAHFVSEPADTILEVRAFAESLQRVIGGPATEPSPLLRRRSLSRRFEALDIPLPELRRAAKAAGGSVNDAYLAAVAGVLRLYHERLGVGVGSLPVAIPISTRRDDDPAGGNHFAGAQLALPVGEPDPALRIARIRDLVLNARAEPAIDAMNLAAPLVERMPSSVIRAIAKLAKANDVQLSNVPGPAHATFMAGAEIIASYVFGPLPGPALMTVLYTQSGACSVGVNCDAAAVTERELFAKCLRDGFDEVLALGRADAALPAAPASKRGRKAKPAAVPQHTDIAERPLVGPPRLPGTVAEIEASPAGPTIGAYFDLDGTLIAGYSGQAFATDRLRRGEVALAEIARTLRFGLDAGLGRADFADLLRLNGEAWAGRSVDDLEELGERLFVQQISERVHREARELVAAHQRRGHTVVLCSSATRFQVAPVARALAIEHVLCNDYVVEDGRLTGEPVLPVIWGETKSAAAQAFAAEHKLEIRESYFYADGDEEIALMHQVGHPRPTNPKGELERVALLRGWPILRFATRAPLGAGGVIRNLAGIASLAPAALGGLAVGYSRDRQAGVDYFVKQWLDNFFAVNGVTFRVQGEQHLRSPRPAVFLFNHVNLFDAMMAGRLVGGKCTGVGKKELEKNPLVGTLGRLMGAVFVDRSDTTSAVAALKPVQDRLAEGISILISPEGTRHVSGEVGPFKKGPFRMAMAGGVPVIPIVIRNALDVASHDAALLRPGVVDVVVLPPISVADWRLEELAKRIEEVRQRVIDTLTNWPSAESDA